MGSAAPYLAIIIFSDPSQISHCNIKGLSVRELIRIENVTTQVKFS